MLRDILKNSGNTSALKTKTEIATTLFDIRKWLPQMESKHHQINRNTIFLDLLPSQKYSEQRKYLQLWGHRERFSIIFESRSEGLVKKFTTKRFKSSNSALLVSNSAKKTKYRTCINISNKVCLKRSNKKTRTNIYYPTLFVQVKDIYAESGSSLKYANLQDM
jgi:hypothetical protein